MNEPTAPAKRDWSGIIGIAIVILLLAVLLPLSINALAAGDPDFGNALSMSLGQKGSVYVASEEDFPVLSFQPSETGKYALYLMTTGSDLHINGEVDQYSKSSTGFVSKDQTITGKYGFQSRDNEYGYRFDNLMLEAGKTYYFPTSQDSNHAFSYGPLDYKILKTGDFGSAIKLYLNQQGYRVAYDGDFPVFSFSPSDSGEYALDLQVLTTTPSSLYLNEQVDEYSKYHTSAAIGKVATLTGEEAGYGYQYEKLYLEAGYTYYFVTSGNPNYPIGYNDISIGAKVTKTKDAPGLTASDVTATYGDRDVRVRASTVANSPLSYAVSAGSDVVAVDARTGALTIKGAGTAIVTVTAAETDLYCRATKNVTVTVKPAVLTIQAYDKTIKVGQSAPALGKGDYSVTGLVNGDQLVKEPTIAYASTPNTAVAGSVKINVSGAAVAVPGNYDIHYVNGVLVIAAISSFDDIKVGEYYYDAVIWAVNHDPQITNGTSKTKFSPDATCTRGQVVTFLWRANGCPEPKISVNPFTDVKADAYYYKAVLWAIEEGITNGTSKTAFSPDEPCTRAHVVTFLWRSAGKPAAGTANPFNDVAAGKYYTDAVLWAVSKDITNGTSANTFSPDSPCTRGQIVTFLYRYMK